MFLLFLFLFIALFFSFLCSMLEAMLLSVTPAFAEVLREEKPKAGDRLRILKEDIDRPLAAILSLNTIAHTVGAAGVGAQAAHVFGDAYLGIVSAVLTFLILVLSEIIPKTIGAVYWRQIAPFGSLVIVWLVRMLYPLVVLSQLITKLISRGKKYSSVTREEFHALADIGKKEGVFHETESHIFKNLLTFRTIQAKDIMTPRVVMFSLKANLTIHDIVKKHIDLKFSRIPLYDESKDRITHYVLKSDILDRIVNDNQEVSLKDLAREIIAVPEIVYLPKLFEELLNEHEYIAIVIDEYGGVSGVVTMEDVLETIMGIEIVDETDEAIDMRNLAREQWKKRAKTKGLITDPEDEKNGG